MTTGHARTHGPQTRTRPPSSWGGGSVVRGTLGWYGDASGGFFLKSLDEWNPRLAFLVFPRITSSSRIDRCDIGRFVLQTPSRSPRYRSRGRSGNSRRRCRSTSLSLRVFCGFRARRFMTGSMGGSPTPITGPGLGRWWGWLRHPGSRRAARLSRDSSGLGLSLWTGAFSSCWVRRRSTR